MELGLTLSVALISLSQKRGMVIKLPKVSSNRPLDILSANWLIIAVRIGFRLRLRLDLSSSGILIL